MEESEFEKQRIWTDVEKEEAQSAGAVELLVCRGVRTYIPTSILDMTLNYMTVRLPV